MLTGKPIFSPGVLLSGSSTKSRLPDMKLSKGIPRLAVYPLIILIESLER